MQREMYRIEYCISGTKRKIWYYMGRDYDDGELDKAKARLKNLRGISRKTFEYRLVKRIYLDEVLDE